MCRPRRFENTKNLIIWFFVMPLSVCVPQETTTLKPGRYIPELYGAHLGKYVPDDSGKYYHIHRPYDGGYGDTGIKYVHDARGNLVPLSTKSLGPKDHLRFMLDFNFDNSGWQIINFEWLRDDDEHYNYKYINENQLFMGNEADESAKDDSISDDSENVGAEPNNNAGGDHTQEEENNNESDVHVEGEYSDKKGYNYSYNNKDESSQNSKNLQQALREVIYYIENNVLTTL